MAKAVLVIAGGFAASIAINVSAWSADLVIAMPNWPSGQATANILKVGIAEEFGLDAEVRGMGTLNAFAGLDAGEVDIHPEVWRPNLDNLVQKYAGEGGSVVLSPKSVTAWQGLCETRAAADKLGIRDIADLKDAAKIAGLDTNADGRGELWIGAPTWSSTAIERIRANSYGYSKQFDLIETEEDVAMAAVDAAVATDQPMVFACYAPHHIFELHDIVRLGEPAYDAAKWKIVLPSEDPLWVTNSSAPVAWPTANFSIAYAKSLRSEHAAVAGFLDRIDFTPEEITEMSYALQVDQRDPYDFAKEWVATHGERVKGWASK